MLVLTIKIFKIVVVNIVSLAILS